MAVHILHLTEKPINHKQNKHLSFTFHDLTKQKYRDIITLI